MGNGGHGMASELSNYSCQLQGKQREAEALSGAAGKSRAAPFVAASSSSLSPRRVENILSTFLINLNALSCLSLHLAPQSLKDPGPAPNSSPRFSTSLWVPSEGSASAWTGVLHEHPLPDGASSLDDADEVCPSTQKKKGKRLLSICSDYIIY